MADAEVTPLPPPQVFFWFKVGEERFTHLDLTGEEVMALEQRFGIEWGELRPIANVTHRIAILAKFAARKDPEGAEKWAKSLTMAELESLVDVERRADDLPDGFVDGLPLPKAEDAT